MSVFSTLRCTQLITEDSQTTRELDIIHLYLQTALVCHSIGNQVQPSHLTLLKVEKTDDNYESLIGISFSPQVLLRLSDLTERCVSYSRKDLTKSVPAPWSRKSTYAVLKQELDEVHIMYCGDSALLDSETLELLQNQEGGAGYYVVGISMLHSMRILLDAAFMPIPLVSILSNECCAVGEAEHNHGTARAADHRRAAYFPGAPRSFWHERLASCLRSARAITSFCRSLLEFCDFAMVSTTIC